METRCEAMNDDSAAKKKFIFLGQFHNFTFLFLFKQLEFRRVLVLKWGCGARTCLRWHLGGRGISLHPLGIRREHWLV